MKKLYVIAHTWRDVDLTIEHFFTPEKAVKRISELTDEDFETKAHPDDDPKEFLDEYYNWSREDNDNMCEIVIALEVIEL